VLRSSNHLAAHRGANLRCAPDPARVAGTRWTIEESFQSGKELAGLDEHQLRRWTSWHRWTILAMLAHAFPSLIIASQSHPTQTPG
jgi:SRSO17 transposase